MKLSDVMGAAGLEIYAEIGLVIFFAVFALVVLRLLAPGRAALDRELSAKPLDDTTMVRHRATEQLEEQAEA